MMIERGDHVVLDEPFSATYYFSAERASGRFDEMLPGSSAAEVMESLASSASQGPVFFKDMAYHSVPYVDDEALSAFVNTFLIRDPRRALPSLHRIWPDFTPEEAGYEAQRELFGRVWAMTGRTPVVIDSDELRHRPAGTVRSWCEAVGIPFVEAALSWAPGMQPQWRLWRDWYEGVARSTGFLPPESDDMPEVGGTGLRQQIDLAMPIYEELSAHALRPHLLCNDESQA